MTSPHADVGAYLLGAMDDAEMTRFEEHLAGCESCGRDLDELGGLVPVLEELRGDTTGGAPDIPAARSGDVAPDRSPDRSAAGVPDGARCVAPPPGDALLGRLLDTVARERRARGRRHLVAAAVGAVLVLGGPAAALLATPDSGGSPAGTESFGADRRSASNPVTGASALLGLADKGWGTAVDLRLTGVRGPRTCSLIAVGRDGRLQTVATWSVPDDGYGTHDRPGPLTVHGAAGLREADIARFDVRATDGTLLVSVPAAPR
jgi:Putative zinc-finger